jgi:phosphoserine phosphatase
MFVLNVIGKGAAPEQFAKLGLEPAILLSPGHAFDLPVAEENAEAILAEARRLAENLKLDVNLVAIAQRRKKLLVADMDSTIIAVECLDELADLAGSKAKIATLTEKAMKGEIEFEAGLRERVGLLKGLPLSALEKTWRERVRLNPGAESLTATMRAHGAHTILVSGGFHYFTRRVARAAGFDEEHGNHLGDDGAALTGEIGAPFLGREGKWEVLKEAVIRRKLNFSEVLVVGDGANDLAMIAGAGKMGGLGLAYHAKPVLAAAANALIAHNDLTALLYLQGYKDQDIKPVG